MELIHESDYKKIYKDGNLVHKVFFGRFTMSNVLNEALNQTRCTDFGIKVPKIHKVEETEEGFDPYWIWNEDVRLTREYIPYEDPDTGYITTPEIDFDDLFEYAKKNNISDEEMLTEFCKLQIKICNIEHGEVRYIVNKMLDNIMKTDLKATYKYFFSFELKDMPRMYNLLHGDFYPTNIIKTKDSEPVVIDWSHAAIGNPIFDLANTYLLFILHDKKPLSNKYLDIYCGITGVNKNEILKIVPYVAASILYRYTLDVNKYKVLIDIIEESFANG